MTASAPVTARIREDLSSGHLRSGQKILQEQLAARYGVSRIPLREALNELQAEGLVVHEPNRGYFVAQLRAQDMQEVYRLRELLEAEAIEAACRNLSDVAIDLFMAPGFEDVSVDDVAAAAGIARRETP